MKTTASIIIAVLTAGTGFSRDFPVAEFGAAGDGETDDGPAIRKAVAAALSTASGSRVVFEKKTYRLDWWKDGSCQVSMDGAKNIAIEGNGATLVNHPRNGLFSLNNCSGVSIRGFTVDYAPLPFTQGMISGVNDTDNDFPGGREKLKFTGIYNIDASGANYVVRNCTFREQRRHAILVRAPGGIIEENTIDGVGGSGVYMTNEIGSFHEGPVPRNCVIRNNVIRNTHGVPIVVGSKRTSDPAAWAMNIRITGYSIQAISAPCIEAFSVNGLEISDN